MGQAKRRGTKEQRIKQATARDKAMDAAGGRDNLQKFFKARQFNNRIDIISDEGEAVSPDKMEIYYSNMEFMKAYEDKFKDVYDLEINK